MARHTSILAVAVLILASAPALAWDDATILQAQGDIEHDIWVTLSPPPAFCLWSSADGVSSFHATEVDGGGNVDCLHPWLMHCDADSIVFSGSWPEFELPFLTVIAVDYQATLECTVEFTRRTRLAALRETAGTLHFDVHTATLTWPDGTVLPLLVEGAGPDQVEVVVPPGVYGVAIDVFAYETASPLGHPAGYAGRVRVTWEDAGPVPVEATSWSRVKGLYRR